MLPRISFTRLIPPALMLAACLGVGATGAGQIERISVTPTELEANGASIGSPAVNASGRYVAFASAASNLYGQDVNNQIDVFVRDRQTGFTQIVSLGDPLGFGPRELLNGTSLDPAISADGSFFAYATDASNAIEADTNDAWDVYARTLGGNNTRVSVSTFGTEGNGDSWAPSMSADGSIVAYQSTSSNLVFADVNDEQDVFVSRLVRGFNGGFRVQNTRRCAPPGVDPDGPSAHAAVSADGRYVAFESTASNLDPNDANGTSDIFVFDTLTNQVERVSLADDGSESTGDSILPAISADGRFVAFVSDSSDLTPGDSNGLFDVFVRDRLLGTTERVSVADDGSEGDGDSGVVLDQLGVTTRGRPSLSSDGRFVAYTSEASNFDPLDGNGVADVFLYDRSNQVVTRASNGVQGEGDLESVSPVLDANASVIVFESSATNLVEVDTNFSSDIFACPLGSTGGGNDPPFADAGEDQFVFEGDEVQLDASFSFDLDGDLLTFFWRQTEGPTVVLDDPTSPLPTFTAPLVEDQELLIFEVEVSDGINPTQVDEVEILVDRAPDGTLMGQITDLDGNPVPFAAVNVIRNDGQEATEQIADGAGFYEVLDVRAGDNTAIFSAPGFEPISIEVTVLSGAVVNLDVQFDSTTATLVGRVRLSDGSPLAGADILLLNTAGEILAEDFTDAAGEYVIPDLDSFLLGEAVILSIQSSDAPTWNAAGLNLDPGTINRRDFQYGSLDVTVQARPGNQQRFLPGTLVEIASGNLVLDAGVTTRKTRRIRFANLPAQNLRLRAANPNLTGVVTSVNVASGGRGTKITVTMRPRGIF